MKHVRTLVLSLGLLFSLARCTQADTIASEGDGEVVSIADGDTFTLLTEGNEQKKIRLYGIDCPERGQDYYSVAKQKLSDLVFRKSVRIEEKDTDRYGRIVAIVFTDQDENVNEELLRSGLAWHYTQYDKNPAWTRLMERARDQKIGLWAQPNPTAPWEWRKQKRGG